jgi:hypothetical protein
MYPTTSVPESPDYWMRLAGTEWVPDNLPPKPGEVASVIAYRCNACAKTFRLVIELPAPPVH